jgi:hypothetical protein
MMPVFGRNSASVVAGIGLAVVGLLALAAPLAAHHAFSAEFDPDKPVQVRGTVTEMLWSNPHAWIYLDVVGDDGEVVNWSFETGPANSLLRRGWRREDLVHGTELVIEGWQVRSDEPAGNARSITFADGTRLFAGTSNPDAEEGQ